MTSLFDTICRFMDKNQNSILTSKKLSESLEKVKDMPSSGEVSQLSPFMISLTVFILAIFVGYYVVWKVTPALHSPLMAVTNAISSVIIVGALIACSIPLLGAAKYFGFLAVMLAAINIFGGFSITHRMLHMFHKKKS